MNMIETTTPVHDVLRRHMLADGLPIVLDLRESHGSWIRDAASGASYLDFFGSYATSPLGFNHPGLRDEQFLERLTLAAINKVTNSDLYTHDLAAFVERFAGIVPPPLRSHLFFIDGGALAVENALKTAFDWKHRRNLAAGRSEPGSRVLHFREAFHGRSGYTLSLTNTDPVKTDYFPKFDWPRIVNPKMRFPFDETAQAATLAAEDEALAQIAAALSTHGHDIAALVIEPIQGEGGDNHFRREFLAELRRIADEHELLLVFDEVQTGFGTTGRWWCCEHFDVVPDVLVFGKKAQVCGIAVSQRVDDVDSVFKVHSRINSTWGGHLVDMIRCRRIVEIIEEEELLANATERGEQLVAGFEALGRSFPHLVDNARGRGVMAAFDLPDPRRRNELLRRLFELELLALPSGHRSIRFRPTLNVRASEVEAALERCERALGRLA